MAILNSEKKDNQLDPSDWANNTPEQSTATPAPDFKSATEIIKPVESAPQAPEIIPEKNREINAVTQESKDDNFLDEAIDGIKQKLRFSKKKPTNIPQVRDQLTIQVEKIMEEGLGEAYKELTPVQKEEFKIAGEKTAWEIRDLLRGAHVKLKKLFKIILKWLIMLPGINRFYLEQEAKIKADKIMALKRLNEPPKM